MRVQALRGEGEDQRPASTSMQGWAAAAPARLHRRDRAAFEDEFHYGGTRPSASAAAAATRPLDAMRSRHRATSSAVDLPPLPHRLDGTHRDLALSSCWRAVARADAAVATTARARTPRLAARAGGLWSSLRARTETPSPVTPGRSHERAAARGRGWVASCRPRSQRRAACGRRRARTPRRCLPARRSGLGRLERTQRRCPSPSASRTARRTAPLQVAPDAGARSGWKADETLITRIARPPAGNGWPGWLDQSGPRRAPARIEAMVRLVGDEQHVERLLLEPRLVGRRRSRPHVALLSEHGRAMSGGRLVQRSAHRVAVGAGGQERRTRVALSLAVRVKSAFSSASGVGNMRWTAPRARRPASTRLAARRARRPCRWQRPRRARRAGR